MCGLVFNNGQSLIGKFSLPFKVSVDILFSRELLPIPTFSRFPFNFCQQTGEGWTGDSDPPSPHQGLLGEPKIYFLCQTWDFVPTGLTPPPPLPGGWDTDNKKKLMFILHLRLF